MRVKITKAHIIIDKDERPVYQEVPDDSPAGKLLGSKAPLDGFVLIPKGEGTERGTALLYEAEAE